MNYHGTVKVKEGIIWKLVQTVLTCFHIVVRLHQVELGMQVNLLKLNAVHTCSELRECCVAHVKTREHGAHFAPKHMYRL
jgi:hypothetical protein